jgi:hypothetical protein
VFLCVWNVLQVYDPECYKILYEQLLVEEAEAEKRRLLREKQNSIVAAERHHVKLFQALDKRKERRLEREARLDTSQKEAEVTAQRMKKLQLEMEANLKTKEKAIHTQGTWKKDDVDHWEFVVRTHKDKFDIETLYGENRKMMHVLEKRNHKSVFDARWQESTGHAEGLELNWTKADPFFLPEGLDGSKPSTPFLGGIRGDNVATTGAYAASAAVGRERDSFSAAGIIGGTKSAGGGARNVGFSTLPPPHFKGGDDDSGGFGDFDSSSLADHSFGGYKGGTASKNLRPPGQGKDANLLLPAVVTGRGIGATTTTTSSSSHGRPPATPSRHSRPTLDVQFDDENDAELLGEDLDDMLAALVFTNLR